VDNLCFMSLEWRDEEGAGTSSGINLWTGTGSRGFQRERVWQSLNPGADYTATG